MQKRTVYVYIFQDIFELAVLILLYSLQRVSIVEYSFQSSMNNKPYRLLMRLMNSLTLEAIIWTNLVFTFLRIFIVLSRTVT